MRIYLYAVLCLLYCYTISSVLAQWVSFLSLDTLLQQASISASSKIQQYSQWQSSDIANLYDMSLDLIQSQIVQNIKTPLDSTLDLMNTRYPSCQSRLDREDLITILSRRRSFAVDFSQLFLDIDWNTTFPTMTQYVQSCQRLLSCMSNETINPPDTQWMRDQCLDITTQQFEISRIVAWSQQQLIPKSDQLHLFMNGTIDDSPYDLLVDIHNISTLLFQTPEAPPQVIAYRLPEVSWWSTPSSVLAGVSQFAPVWWWFANQDNPLTAANVWSSLNPTAISVGSSSRWVSGFAWPNVWNSSVLTSQQIIDGFKSGLSVQDKEWISQDDKPSYIEEPLSCDIDSWISQTNQDSQQILNTLSRDLKQLNTSFNSQQRLLQSLNNGRFWFWSGNTTGGLDDDGWSSPESVDALVDQWFDLFADPNDPSIRSCLRKCDGLWFTDKLICRSQCLCWQIVSPGLWKSPLAALWGDEYLLPPGAFTLRFCRVPATRQAVPQSPSVVSLEQMMSATNTVLKELKESWQLIKHKQTKEVLETSMQKTKLWQLFAFDLAISFKPIFAETSVSQRALDAQETVQRVKTQIKGSNNIDQQQERNKYLIKVDACVQVNDNTISTNNLSQSQWQQDLIDQCRANRAPKISYEVVSSAQTEQSVVLWAHIDGFIDAQQRLWAQMNEILLQISSVSKTLQQRISTPN